MIVPNAEPSLLGTVRQIAEVSRAIWADYRMQRRYSAHMRRMQRRVDALYQAPAPGWRNDTLHLVVVLLSLASAVFLAIGGWL